METILLRQAAPLASARGRCAAAPQTPRCIRRRRRVGVCAAKTSRRLVPDPFPPPPVAAGWTTAGDSTGRDETAPAGYSIAAGQQKRKGITPHTLVPRPLLLYVLALQGWRPCRLSPASRGKSLRRSGPSPPRGPVEARIRPRIERQAGPTPPRWMPFASQNCPQPYQGESGGLEPAMKPMAGQAGAPRGRGPSAEGPPLRGRSALTGGPVPPCAPLPSGGDFNFRSPTGEGNCAPAGATPPPVNLWPLSFDQESGDLGPGRCLTSSQTTNTSHGTR